MRRSVCVATVCGALTVGCADQPRPPFSPVAQTVHDQSGWSVQRPASTRGPIVPPAEWFAKPLTVDAAVRTALGFNRRLAAAYDQLDISQADLLQAGLLQNPVLDLSVRLPDRSSRKTYFDFGVSDSLVDLLFAGVRRKLAAAELTQAQATTAHQVLQTVADVRSAYFGAVAAEQERQLRQTIVDAATAADAVARQIHQAGNSGPTEPLRAHVTLLKTRGELIAAEAQVALSRQKLAALMGIDGSQPWTLAEHLADVPASASSDGLESLALRQRQDLLAAKKSVLIAAGRLGIVADTRFFGDASVGPEAERETDGQWRIGPTISVPIPLFDQGQAAVAKAKAAMQRSADEYQALRIDVLAQVRSTSAKLESARSMALLYRDEILPTQQQLLDQTQRRYDGMYDSVFVLLEAKQTQIDNAVKYVGALRDYWIATADLDAALGGRLPSEPTSAATLPTTREKSKVNETKMDGTDMENMDMHMQH